MKKIFSLLLALVLCLSCLGVSAKVPEALTKNHLNYTATFKAELKEAEVDSLIALLDEMEVLDEVENYVNLEMLIESLMSEKETLNLQLDVSSDLKKYKFGLTGETAVEAAFNNQLTVTADMKYGVWLNFDLSIEKPVYELTYMTPMANKYVTFDVFEFMDEEEKKLYLDMLAKTHNNEYLNNLGEKIMSSVAEHGEIKSSAAKCTIKISNEAFIKIVKDFIGIAMDTVVEIAPQIIDENPEVAKASVEMVKQLMPSLDGAKFLGEDGITLEYKLTSGKISKATGKVDVEFDVAAVLEALEIEWEYETRPVISFEILTERAYSSYGKTKVDFPVLTEENSINLAETILAKAEENYEIVEQEEDVPEYPLSYFTYYPEKVLVKDDMVYLPLRDTLETAYEGNISIGFENGAITITSEYFDDCDEIAMVIGENKATIDGETIETAPLIMEDGITYICESTLMELFLIELSEVCYDFLGGFYWASVWSY